MKGVIVADIISSTSLSLEQLISLREELQNFIDEYVGWFKEHGCVFWGRVVRGDMLEERYDGWRGNLFSRMRIRW